MITLSEYLEKVDLRAPLAKSGSFFDYAWRQQTKAIRMKLVEGTLQGVPAEVRGEFIVSSDALHMLSAYHSFKRSASIQDFLDVLAKFKENDGGWRNDDYVPFHLQMYARSFDHMQLMKVELEGEDAIERKDSKVVFIPVNSEVKESYHSLPSNFQFYEVLGESQHRPQGSGQPYLSLSVFEGFRMSSGSEPEEEPMAV